MMDNRRSAGSRAWIASAWLPVLLAGCTLDPLLQATASLGGATAGTRGNAQVLFINNTPYRAIFTFGLMDNLDQDTVPNLTQFSDGAETPQTLEGNSQVGPLTIQCARIYSIGGEGLIARVEANLQPDEYDATALVPGAYFSSAAPGEPDANAPTEGTAAPSDAPLGVDFQCNSLVIYRFEFDDLGPNNFRIDQTVITSTSTR